MNNEDFKTFAYSILLFLHVASIRILGYDAPQLLYVDFSIFHYLSLPVFYHLFAQVRLVGYTNVPSAFLEFHISRECQVFQVLFPRFA